MENGLHGECYQLVSGSPVLTDAHAGFFFSSEVLSLIPVLKELIMNLFYLKFSLPRGRHMLYRWCQSLNMKHPPPSLNNVYLNSYCLPSIC